VRGFGFREKEWAPKDFVSKGESVRVSGTEFRERGSEGLEFRVRGSGFRVWDEVVRVSGVRARWLGFPSSARVKLCTP